MKTYRTNNLEVNFITKDVADAASKLAMDKIWMLPVDAVVQTTYIGDVTIRRYASGWIEMRGWRDGSGTSTVTFPIPFPDLSYAMNLTNCGSGYAYYTTNTTNSTTIGTSGTSYGVIWSVAGMGDS
ncbi:MAG: hypothetical protein LBP65_01935 [Puniceicoccales bacterium]|jgi:hypothetical protein|nr:hypothetical protein [Puniceicoccales bacterium]